MQRRTFNLALAGLASSVPAWATSYDLAPWPAGQPLPRLQGQDQNGKTWNLSTLAGRAVVVNFWASWCEPCRAEMPSLQDMAEIYGPDKLVVLAINFKESAARAAQFVRATNFNLPVLLDPTGDIARQWGVKVFPTSILISDDGKPRARIRGEVDWTGREAEKLIAPLLPRQTTRT